MTCDGNRDRRSSQHHRLRRSMVLQTAFRQPDSIGAPSQEARRFARAERLDTSAVPCHDLRGAGLIAKGDIENRRDRTEYRQTLEELMRRYSVCLFAIACFATLFLTCYAPVLFGDRQFGYRDAAPLLLPALSAGAGRSGTRGGGRSGSPRRMRGCRSWETRPRRCSIPANSSSRSCLIAWGARVYVVAPYGPGIRGDARLDAVVADELGRIGAECAELRLRRADPVPVLQRHLSGGGGLAAAGASCGRSLGSPGPAVGPARAGDRLGDADAGRRPESAYLLGWAAGGYAAGTLAWSRWDSGSDSGIARSEVPIGPGDRDRI